MIQPGVAAEDEKGAIKPRGEWHFRTFQAENARTGSENTQADIRSGSPEKPAFSVVHASCCPTINFTMRSSLLCRSPTALDQGGPHVFLLFSQR
jgi:hypothetical protein